MSRRRLYLAGLAALSGVVTPPPTATLDKSRYLFYGTAAHPSSTPALFYDQSGRGNHFTQADPSRQPPRVVDASNRLRYHMNAGPARSFNSPLVQEASEFTFYAKIDLLDNEAETYLLDSLQHSLLLGLGPGVGVFYTPLLGVHDSSVRLPPSTILVTWVLSQPSLQFFVDGVERQLLNSNYAASPLNGGRLGGDYANPDFGQLRGYLRAFVALAGVDTAEQRQLVWADLADK